MWRLCILSKFSKKCTDVSYVAGEGVELTVHKKSVLVEEIEEVQLRSRRAQFIYDRNYNRIGLQPSGQAPSRLPVKKLRRLLHKKRKVRVFVWMGILENIISDYRVARNFFRFCEKLENTNKKVSMRLAVACLRSAVAIWPVTGQGVKTLNDRQSHIVGKFQKIERF